MIRRLLLYLDWLKDERHIQKILLGLVLLAFVLRLATVLVVPVDYRLRKDAEKYVSLAQKLVSLEPYGLEPGIADARIPPGYPIFLASIFALTGGDLMTVRIAQAVLGALAVWLTFLLGKKTVSSEVGLLGALILTVYPVWIIWPALLLTETLFAVLLLMFALCLIQAMGFPSFKYAIASGATFGLSLWAREVFYGFPVLLPLTLWWSRVPWRRAWRYLLLFAIAVLVILSPWLIRNYLAFGHLFYTEGSAYARYRVTGVGYLSPYIQAWDQNPPTTTKSPEYYEYYGRPKDMVRISRLWTEPVLYVSQILHRLVEFWLHPNGLESLPNNVLLRGIYVAVHIGLLGLAVAGLLPGLKGRDASVGSLALLLAYVTGTGVFFGAPNPRYNLPFLPIVFVFTAKGFLELVQNSRIGGHPGTVDTQK